ncbi:hypothetical protein VTN31DRAFT_2102 [Thermomyces dupontii]|uniref:uncharacterized protein n=1 Tax=Talaromyces thermophilus TaxID=28565 RepID=UPI00374422FE
MVRLIQQLPCHSFHAQWRPCPFQQSTEHAEEHPATNRPWKSVHAHPGSLLCPELCRSKRTSHPVGALRVAALR